MVIALSSFIRTVVITTQVCIGIYLCVRAPERKSSYHQHTILYFGLTLFLSSIVMLPDVLFKSLESWFVSDTTFQVLFFSLLVNRTFTRRNQKHRELSNRVIFIVWFTLIIFLRVIGLYEIYFAVWYLFIIIIPSYIVLMIIYTILHSQDYFDITQNQDPFFLNPTSLKITGFGIILAYFIPLTGFLAEPILHESRFIIQDGGILFGISLATGALIYDLTERRKRLEHQQKILMNKIRESNEELRSFNYVVSHDLKVPLRSINNIARWLHEDYQEELNETGREYLKLLKDNTHRMHNFIEELLKYSKVDLEQEKRSNVDMNILIEEIIEILEIPYNIDIIKKNSFPTLYVNKVRMQQIMQNLLSNAVKFIDKPRGEIILDYSEQKKYHQFVVKDNGIGIPEEDQQRIFQLFYTNSDIEESTGLGLSIVKKIVTMYGGQVWVESVEGEGSSFFFTIAKKQ